MNNVIRPKVGAFVLETLTTGLYLDPLDTLRELIQNAFDSITQAVKTESLDKLAGSIVISIDRVKRTVTVCDNGTGIQAAAVESSLLNVGMSQKDAEENVGFRGIGRLAGIAYCDRLVFETSATDETTVSTVEFDCMGIRRELSSGKAGATEINDILESYSKVDVTPHGEPQKHYFRVTLEGIIDSAEMFLDVESLENYLSLTAPVDFDVQRFFYAPKINEWIDSRKITLPTTSIVLRSDSGERQIYKPYGTNYHSQKGRLKVDVKDVELFTDGTKDSNLFWGWIGVTDLLGMIEHETAGIRVRKNNFSVGGTATMEAVFSQISKTNERFNNWYIGEVHILGDVIPNSRRDGFEEYRDWPAIQKELVEHAKKWSKKIRDASGSRNRPIVKVIAAANKEIDEVQKTLEVGLASKEQQAEIVESLEKQISKVESAGSGQRTDTEKNEIASLKEQLIEKKEAIANTDRYVARSLNANLSRRERKVIERIMSILHDRLDDNTFELIRDTILDEFGNHNVSLTK